MHTNKDIYSDDVAFQCEDYNLNVSTKKTVFGLSKLERP